MVRHVWASDRLSEGVVGAATDSWRAGLDVLAQAPLADARTANARKLWELATAAKQQIDKSDFATRARTYGEILVACQACHASDRKPAK